MRIAVTGGKGGTGKSTISVSLAVLLARSNKVLLVDADVECPNVHLLLSHDLTRDTYEEVRTFLPLIDEEKCTRCAICRDVCYEGAIIAFKGSLPIVMAESCSGCMACQIACPEDAILTSWKSLGRIYSWKYTNDDTSLDLLTGMLNEGQEASQPIVRKLSEKINVLSNNYDHVIIDTAAGTGISVARALDRVDFALAVTEPTPMGLHDLTTILKLTAELGIPRGVIVNRADLNMEYAKRISQVIEEFNGYYLGEIPYLRDVEKAYVRGIPPVLFSEEIRRIFEKLVEKISTHLNLSLRTK